MWFLVGLAKQNTAWHAVWVLITFCFITDKKRKKYVCFVKKEKRDSGLASCAYWADNQSYTTTGSVQQEQVSSPLTTKPEANASTGRNRLLTDYTREPLFFWQLSYGGFYFTIILFRIWKMISSMLVPQFSHSMCIGVWWIPLYFKRWLYIIVCLLKKHFSELSTIIILGQNCLELLCRARLMKSVGPVLSAAISLLQIYLLLKRFVN